MRTTIEDIVRELERLAPPSLQEDYDNAGLIVGSLGDEATGALLTLDCTEDVVDEAVGLGANLVIAHHPIVFRGIKKLSGNSYVERTLLKAIRANVAIYACHTNIDSVPHGVNAMICARLGISGTRILQPKEGHLLKLATFVPESHARRVEEALFAAGAGHIGHYDACSFQVQGTGTFRGDATTKPFAGEKGKLSREAETRIETVLPRYLQGKVVRALLEAHPYEEVAYDLYHLANSHASAGSGMIGRLSEPMAERDFLAHIKTVFNVPVIKHTGLTGKKIGKVAVCGGSGRFLLDTAIRQGADAFITSDFKYHEYFDADGRLLLADVGHYESEQYTPHLFYELLSEKFATFALHLSKINTNPVNYF